MACIIGILVDTQNHRSDLGPATRSRRWFRPSFDRDFAHLGNFERGGARCRCFCWALRLLRTRGLAQRELTHRTQPLIRWRYGRVFTGYYDTLESQMRLRMRLRIIYTFTCAMKALTRSLESALLPPRLLAQQKHCDVLVNILLEVNRPSICQQFDSADFNTCAR